MQAPIKRGTATGTRWTPPDKEWLELQYITLQKSAVGISYEIGAAVGGNTVLKWLRLFGIQVRSQSEAVSLTRVGRRNPSWKGGTKGYWKREFRRIGPPAVCSICGTAENLDVHHRDGDSTNNVFENFMYLCQDCHMKLHGKLRILRNLRNLKE